MLLYTAVINITIPEDGPTYGAETRATYTAEEAWGRALELVGCVDLAQAVERMGDELITGSVPLRSRLHSFKVIRYEDEGVDGNDDEDPTFRGVFGTYKEN